MMSVLKNSKIFLVSIQYPPNITGGGGVIVRELSRELVKNNQDIMVLCFGLNNKEEENLVLSDNDGDFHIQVKRFFADDSKLLKNPYEGTKKDEFERFEQFIEKVFNYLRDKKGIVHLHGHYLVPYLGKKLKLEGQKNPVIISYHALESIALEAKAIENQFALNYIKEKEKLSLKFCDIAIVNSNKVKNQLRTMYPEEFDDNKVKILQNPVNNELIHYKETTKQEKIENRKKFKVNGKSHLIFSVGRIDKIKGYDILIKSLQDVAKQTNHEISLVIAGFLEEKHQKYFNHLNKIAKDLKKQNPKIDTIFIPNISNEEKIRFLDDAICFVSAAILEPFGITTLESWIRRKPVITSETEGSKDLFSIENEINPPFLRKDKGIIVANKPNRRKNLAKAIIYLLNNLEESKQMGKIGQQFVINNYTWKSVVKLYLEQYQSII